MPRISVPGFVGPSNVQRATNQDIEETINRYYEPTAPGQSKVGGSLLPCPGLRPFAQVMDSPGATIFYQDGRCFVVIGTTFAEVFANGTTIARGTVALPSSTLPASIVSNGTAGGQLLIVSGGQGYVFTLLTNAFTVIDTGTFPGTGFPVGTAQQCEFMDGYGIVLIVNSRAFQISGLEDFTAWDPLDIAERSEGSDNIQAMRRNHREIWFWGTKTGEVWYDSGDALFPFAPVPGTFLEQGSASVSSTRVNGTVAWLTLTERGIGVCSLANGYDPEVVSTPALDRFFQSSSQLQSARLFSQQQEGHIFLWVNVSDLPETPCYDYATKQWHKRALWDPTLAQYLPHEAVQQAFAFNKHLVVSRLSGNIYELSLTAYDDSIV